MRAVNEDLIAAALKALRATDPDGSVEHLQSRIVRVYTRTGWTPMDDNSPVSGEYQVLLYADGACVRVLGGVDGEGLPESASLEVREFLSLDPWQWVQTEDGDAQRMWALAHRLLVAP